jgi:hypothetical protein
MHILESPSGLLIPSSLGLWGVSSLASSFKASCVDEIKFIKTYICAFVSKGDLARNLPQTCTIWPAMPEEDAGDAYLWIREELDSGAAS